MTIKIPEDIQREILLLRQGKKIRKRVEKEPTYFPVELFSMAVRNLELLNKVANTEPILSFLNDSGRAIMVLDKFNALYPQPHRRDNVGSLVLRKIGDRISLYDWIDADYPANRSDSDYRLVTERELRKWHLDSLKQFALLTEREIWRNIKGWLKIMRTHL